MRFTILTLFPELIESYQQHSIIGAALKNRIIKLDIINIREFAKGRHKQVDDRPFGGGPGMVLMAEPILQALWTKSKRLLANEKTLIIITERGGKKFDQKVALQCKKKFENVVIIAGHYEGIDIRVKKILQCGKSTLRSYSIGDYTLTGGELPALVICDAITRLIPGVLGNRESLEEGRISGHDLYTRPRSISHKMCANKQFTVPQVLIRGDHQAINAFRNKQAR